MTTLATILPPDDAAVHCPRCGRVPTLHETAHLSWFECRKWFGLRICTKGPEVHCEALPHRFARR